MFSLLKGELLRCVTGYSDGFSTKIVLFYPRKLYVA